MINRQILYSQKAKNTKYCPYCKKNTEFLLDNCQYFTKITCNICKNVWFEGESAKNA
jgi:hypothetical protein